MNLDRFRKRYKALAKAGEPVAKTLAKEFKISIAKVRRIARQEREAGTLLPLKDYKTQGVKKTETNGVVILEAKGTEITTLDELLADGTDDLDKFQVTEYTRNKWGKNWQVKAKFGLRKPQLAMQAMFDKLLETIRDGAPKGPLNTRHKLPEEYGVLLELGLFDFHLGNLAWHEESGENWSLDIAAQTFRAAVNGLLLRAVHHYKIDKILYAVGNDFFHADSKEAKTTAGTQMNLDTRFQKMIDIGVDLQRWAIDQLRQIAPVDVIVVPGNHDENSSYFLGKILSAYYGHCPDVNIINNPALRKYYRYGNTLLGFTHGCHEPLNRLPLIMASEAKEDWGNTCYRAFHVGHFHHRSAQRFDYLDTDGVLVRILPSLTAADAWHKQKGLSLATRAAEAYLYDKESGLIGTLHAQRRQECHLP